MAEEKIFIRPNIPCWDSRNIDKAISLLAKLGDDSLHYFMACHNPITNIKDQNNQKVTEEELFHQIFSPLDPRK